MAVMFLDTAPPTGPLVATFSVVAPGTNVPIPSLALMVLLVPAMFIAKLDKDVDDDEEGII